MPCTDTSNLAETLVSLARKLFGAPSVGDTLKSVTLGDGNDVDVLVLLEDGANLDRLLKELVAKVDLVGDGASVDLDLHEVGLLLAETGLADLGVGKYTDDSAVLANALELASNRLATILCVLLGVAGEGLLLGAVPVLVEPTLDGVGEMVGPDSGEGSETTGSFDVTDETDSDEGRSFDNGDGFHHLTFMEFCDNYERKKGKCERQDHALEPGRSRSRTTWVIPAL